MTTKPPRNPSTLASESATAPAPINFEDPEATHSPIVGGKFSSLARLYLANINVPTAVCIPCSVLFDAVADAGGRTLLQEYRQELAHQNRPHMCTLAAKLRELVIEIRPSNRVATQIIAGSSHLRRPLAVRSSATSEDSLQQSFAGMFDSVLGITTDIQLIEAIRSCWASLFSDRIIGYIAQHPSITAEAALAVVCQELVDATVGGVVFTRDPVSNTGTAIEASWGIPSPLVGGEIIPDRFDVAADGHILRRRLGSKQLISYYSLGQVRRRSATAAERATFCLSDQQIMELHDIGRHLESLFRHPQDIEWAYLGQKLYILQSRPITGPMAGAHDQQEVRQ
jgi:phosphoenolpyruvate synthase/pyruvate phosphate dikinase